MSRRRGRRAALELVLLGALAQSVCASAVSVPRGELQQQQQPAERRQELLQQQAPEPSFIEHVRRRLASADEYEGAQQGIGDVEIWQLIVVTLLVLTLGSLAAGAGVGGGGLFVPIYWLILDVGPKAAVPLSKATILGGALGNFVTIGRLRHPEARRPIIDYEASTFMQSGELLGVVFGVLLNMLLAKIFIIVFLVIILTYNALRTTRKAFATRKKEDAARAKKAEEATSATEAGAATPDTTAGDSEEKTDQELAADLELVGAGISFGMPETRSEEEEQQQQKVDTTPKQAEVGGCKPADAKPAAAPANGAGGAKGMKPNNSHTSLLALGATSPPPTPDAAAARKSARQSGAESPGGSTDDGEKPGKAEPAAEAAVEVKGGNPSDLQDILDEDSQQFPRWAWMLLAPMTIYTIAYAVLSKGFALNDPCDSAAYWSFYFTPVPVLGGFMWLTAVILKRRHARRVAAGFKYLETDMQWTPEMLMKFPKTALVAGVTAGLLGIGGGMVIGPLFLTIGMQPQVGTSSCAFMILFTAASGVAQYAAAGKLGWQLCLFCVGIGFVSGQLGQRGVNKVIKATGRPSYVIFLLAGIISLACASMAIAGIARIAIDLADGMSAEELFEFSTDSFTCNDDGSSSNSTRRF